MPGDAPLVDLPVPDSLLAPLLDVAGAVLTTLEPHAVPSVLRPLVGFDRKGLSSGSARLQLRRALETDEQFRTVATERFLGRGEVRAALDAWSVPSAIRRVDDAAERDDLPLLASALFAARPEGWQLGMGAVCVANDRTRHEKELDDEVRAREVQLAGIDEARRRADEAREGAQREVERLERDLRGERQARRDREAKAAADASAASDRAREWEAEAERSRRAATDAEARLRREEGRARDAEHQLREARRELAAVRRELTRGTRLPPPAAAALEEAWALVRDLAVRIRTVADATREADSRPEEEQASPTRPAARHVDAAVPRAAAPCPPGMVADSPPALEEMARSRGVTLVVDGYNVSMRGWPQVGTADQRERLTAALSGLHIRTRADVILVFDGADVGTAVPPRRRGVRVVFSGAGEEADHVVVREAGALPPRVPVVVVSSDGWVRSQAERAGATVVSADSLLGALRG